MYRIRRFGVVRTATVVAVAYAIVFGFIFIPLALFGTLLMTPRGGAPAAGVIGGMAFLAIVFLVIYPLFVWIATALACLVYNLAARWVGGIEVEIDRPPQALAGSGWAPPGHVQPNSQEQYGQGWAPAVPGYPQQQPSGTWPPPDAPMDRR